jgi:hypothetical protein
MSHGLPVRLRCFSEKLNQGGSTMTQQQNIIKRKLNMLDFSEQLGNISEACRRLGVSRQHYYDIKAALHEEGINDLLEKSRNKPRIGNRVSGTIEERVMSYCLEYPTHGQARVANELKKEGIILSSGGVCSVWLRHGLEKSNLRLKRLEKWEKQGIFSQRIKSGLWRRPRRRKRLMER